MDWSLDSGLVVQRTCTEYEGIEDAGVQDARDVGVRGSTKAWRSLTIDSHLSRTTQPATAHHLNCAIRLPIHTYEATSVSHDRGRSYVSRGDVAVNAKLVQTSTNHLRPA